MNKILTIILVFFGTIAFGQHVEIDTFQLRSNHSFTDLKADKMIFPIIQTGHEKIDSIINHDLKDKFTSKEYPNENLDSTLTKWAGDQVSYLDFEVSYNANGILSLNISTEGCGAYCTHWTKYFNYSIETGETLNISEIIDTTGAFRTKVYTDKETQYGQQKKELKELLNDPASGLDESTYEWALEYYQNCESSFDLETFAIYPDRLEIIERCNPPNAIKYLTPIITLKYIHAEYEEYLKIKTKP